MASYTFGSEEFLMAILQKQEKDLPGGKYPIELNSTDFRVFITILQKLALYGKVTHKDIETIPGYGGEFIEPIEDWAWQFLSSISETLGVEGI